MLQKINHTLNRYPRQFWLMFFGMLVSTTGSSMIWPFLLVYVSGKLQLPLTTVTSLITLNALMGLSSFIVGPVVDRFGRKWVMAASLLLNGVIYLFMSSANSYPAFAVLMMLSGAANPLFRVGSDAMLADLIPQEKRIDAYALLRMSNNLGISIGPAIGGFIAASSYSTAFYMAAAGLIIYSLLITFFARETIPLESANANAISRQPLGGYLKVLADKPYIAFVGSITLTQVCAAMIWILLAVYAKTNYGVLENQYGFIPTTNALMVVIFQVAVTTFSRRFASLPVMALGALFYTVATASVALGRDFWSFWGCMVIATAGELLLVPTASTFTANRAPLDMRGRYMSIFGLTWTAAAFFGPLLGGVLNDNIGPQAIWFGGAAIGSLSILALLGLWLVTRQRGIK
jgi:MFS family permease